MRDPVGPAIYARRKAIVEPVNGVLKEQREDAAVSHEGTREGRGRMDLATTAYNLTHKWRANQPPQPLPGTHSFSAAFLVALVFKLPGSPDSLHTDSIAPPDFQGAQAEHRFEPR